MFSQYPKLVKLTYITLTVSMLLLLFFFPDNGYKIALAILIPLIVWLPLDILWIKRRREQKRNKNSNVPS